MKKLLWLIGLVVFTVHIFAQGTAFTYQGRLNSGANPANGVYDLRFALFQYDTGGSAVLGPITNAAVTVSNGLFTVLLDFGPYDSAAFGRGNWLEISARTNGTGAFTLLNPRQQMTPTPRATYAAYAGGPLPGAGFNATSLNGLDSSAFWQIGGNAGTTAGTHFLGTTDNQALELKVNNARGLRIEPTGAGVNFIAGNTNNSVGTNVFISTIGGGQFNTIEANATAATIDGGDINTVQFNAAESVIGGGVQNIIGTNSFRAVIAGGLFNRIGSNAINSVISGGRQNRITNDSQYATISGGWSNVVQAASSFAVISGGANSEIGTNSSGAAIGGGNANRIGDETINATIAGGANNHIGYYAPIATIGGGTDNTIGDNAADGGVIAGGRGNGLDYATFHSVISGGWNNHIFADSENGVIGGGAANEVHASYGVIPGGNYNTVSGAYSFAAGYDAHALHDGCFVWSDSYLPLFASSTQSTSSNQFIIRASGGMGIGVNNPQQQLSVASGVNIDQNNLNNGTIVSALTFGSGSGEGIGSKRTPGGTQYGLDFYSNFARRMTILNNGNVGIGTAGPNFLLEVNGSAGKPGGGSWSVASDERLKKNIRPLGGALDKLLALHGVNFEYIDPAKIHELSGERMGLVAQEVEKIFPDWVETGADGYKRVTVRGLEALLVESLRELQQRQEAKLASELKRRDEENVDLKIRLEKLERLFSENRVAGTLNSTAVKPVSQTSPPASRL